MKNRKRQPVLYLVLGGETGEKSCWLQHSVIGLGSSVFGTVYIQPIGRLNSPSLGTQTKTKV